MHSASRPSLLMCSFATQASTSHWDDQ